MSEETKETPKGDAIYVPGTGIPSQIIPGYTNWTPVKGKDPDKHPGRVSGHVAFKITPSDKPAWPVDANKQTETGFQRNEYSREKLEQGEYPEDWSTGDIKKFKQYGFTPEERVKMSRAFEEAGEPGLDD